MNNDSGALDKTFKLPKYTIRKRFDRIIFHEIMLILMRLFTDGIVARHKIFNFKFSLVQQLSPCDFKLIGCES